MANNKPQIVIFINYVFFVINLNYYHCIIYEVI